MKESIDFQRGRNYTRHCLALAEGAKTFTCPPPGCALCTNRVPQPKKEEAPVTLT